MTRTHDTETEAVLKILCAKFPKAFVRYERRRRPLKIGIHRELQAALGDSVDAKLLKKALRAYVINSYYRRALVAGAKRIDLDGNPAGVVTTEEASPAVVRPQRQKQQPVAADPAPTIETPAAPRRDGLAALKAAAQRRKALMST